MHLITCMNVHYHLGQLIWGFIGDIGFFLNLRLAVCLTLEICLDITAGAGHSCLLRRGISQAESTFHLDCMIFTPCQI